MITVPEKAGPPSLDRARPRQSVRNALRPAQARGQQLPAPGAHDGWRCAVLEHEEGIRMCTTVGESPERVYTASLESGLTTFPMTPLTDDSSEAMVILSD